jgi:N6-adenosine-specific RNA methylase IME4
MFGLPENSFGAILADPPWTFRVYSGKGKSRSAERHYDTLTTEQLALLPVHKLAAKDCMLFLWVSWPLLFEAKQVIDGWGFTYKTCAFDWMKAHIKQPDLFRDDADALMGMGYYTRSNSEPCLLATRGEPHRNHSDVRMGIIEPRRQHSRKPDCVYERIERLVDGPYLELFARTTRPGWTSWGMETDKFDVTETRNAG